MVLKGETKRGNNLETNSKEKQKLLCKILKDVRTEKALKLRPNQKQGR